MGKSIEPRFIAFDFTNGVFRPASIQAPKNEDLTRVPVFADYVQFGEEVLEVKGERPPAYLGKMEYSSLYRYIKNSLRTRADFFQEILEIAAAAAEIRQARYFGLAVELVSEQAQILREKLEQKGVIASCKSPSLQPSLRLLPDVDKTLESYSPRIKHPLPEDRGISYLENIFLGKNPEINYQDLYHSTKPKTQSVTLPLPTLVSLVAHPTARFFD